MVEKEKYFEYLGDDFEKYIDDYDVVQRARLIFNNLLKDVDFQDKRVLEIGCGTGRISAEIAKYNIDLTVLDIGENLVRRTMGKIGCKGVVGDACCLPFSQDSFDIIISSECIEHTTNPILAIQEMCRVCIPGGIVCITSPNKLWYPVLWLSIKTGMRKFRGIENWLYPHTVRTIMKKCGFEDFRVSGCHCWPFQLKLTRPLLRWLDQRMSGYLYPLMINYGISGKKNR